MEPKLSSDLLRGHTDTIVLGVLLHQDRYGFEIYNAILSATDGQYELKEPKMCIRDRSSIAFHQSKYVCTMYGQTTLAKIFLTTSTV